MTLVLSLLMVVGVLASGPGLGDLVFDETAAAKNRHRDRNRNRVLIQFTDDLNDGDVEAAMRHFAPDAVKVGGTVCFPLVCHTPEEIRAEWANDVANNIHIQILDYRRFRNIEVARVELTFANAPGPIVATVAVAKRGDQFVSFSALRDTSGS